MSLEQLPEGRGEMAPIRLHRRVVADNIGYADSLRKKGWIDAAITTVSGVMALGLAYLAKDNPGLLPLLCVSGGEALVGFAMTIFNFHQSATIDATARTGIEVRNAMEK